MKKLFDGIKNFSFNRLFNKDTVDKAIQELRDMNEKRTNTFADRLRIAKTLKKHPKLLKEMGYGYLKDFADVFSRKTEEELKLKPNLKDNNIGTVITECMYLKSEYKYKKDNNINQDATLDQKQIKDLRRIHSKKLDNIANDMAEGKINKLLDKPSPTSFVQNTSVGSMLKIAQLEYKAKYKYGKLLKSCQSLPPEERNKLINEEKSALESKKNDKKKEVMQVTKESRTVKKEAKRTGDFTKYNQLVEQEKTLEYEMNVLNKEFGMVEKLAEESQKENSSSLSDEQVNKIINNSCTITNDPTYNRAMLGTKEFVKDVIKTGDKNIVNDRLEAKSDNLVKNNFIDKGYEPIVAVLCYNDNVTRNPDNPNKHNNQEMDVNTLIMNGNQEIAKNFMQQKGQREEIKHNVVKHINNGTLNTPKAQEYLTKQNNKLMSSLREDIKNGLDMGLGDKMVERVDKQIKIQNQKMTAVKLHKRIPEDLDLEAQNKIKSIKRDRSKSVTSQQNIQNKKLINRTRSQSHDSQGMGR